MPLIFTANTLVVERGAGVVFDEPSVCCFSGNDHAPEVVAVGIKAQNMAGRVTKPLRVIRPLANGVLSDIDAACELLRFATRAHKRSWRLTGLRALIGVPADATQAERNALTTAACVDAT